ncbi:MAG: hypothetical protein NWQ45_13700 [Congregibacter sp.]|nr:hypothetical protein [Congregibacter sp.]
MLNDSRRSSVFVVGICMLAIFVLALALRLQYQSESRVDTPLRADSGKYFTAAFNYYFHGVRSLDKPSLSTKPNGRTDLSPGYPLFLTLFFSDKPQASKIFQKVGTVQAVLGATTAALTFLLAYTGLPIGWALLAGCLTALSPHLIALSQLMLTETVFTFLVVSGLFLATLAYRRQSLIFAVTSTLILIAAGYVRTIGFVLPVLLIPIFLTVPQSPSVGLFTTRRLTMSAAPILAFALFAAGLWGLEQVKKSDSSRAMAPQSEYQRIGAPAAYLAATIKPPQFLVDGDSHILQKNRNTEWKRPTNISFADAPAAYINWNVWGRWFWMWHFDNAYIGDVYIYPMLTSGFEENDGLKAIHVLMQFLHWPLYLLSWIGVAMLAKLFFESREPTNTNLRSSTTFWPIALAFAIFLAALSIVAWLPRYTIPLRPVSYVLASFALYYFTVWCKTADS